MRILKSHPLLKMVNSYTIDSPQPSNISYFWNFGSLLAVCLIIQIVTGVTLAMHYNPSVSEAFNSVEHIMRDVNNGWLIRYLHSNTASAFFFIVYLHIGRGLYYGSYRAPRTLVWTIGTIIFILMMATAFLGYDNSPKWPKSNLYFLLNTTLENPIFIYFFMFLFILNFTLLYLDDFKLSPIYSIMYFQILSYITLCFIIIIILFNPINISDAICHINDKDNINLHTHVSLEKDAGKAIGQGLNTIGSQLGLGATIAGVSSGVAKGIAKSSVPPFQKVGIILSAGLIGGLSHSKISAININKYLNSVVNKIIYLNKKNEYYIYIWLILIALIVALCFSAYACHDLYSNIDSYIAVHNNKKK